MFYLKQAGFYSEGIGVKQDVTQGDIDSPILFNIIIDAVLRAWRKASETTTQTTFYVDDGILYNRDHIKLQRDLDTIIELFQKSRPQDKHQEH